MSLCTPTILEFHELCRGCDEQQELLSLWTRKQLQSEVELRGDFNQAQELGKTYFWFITF